MINLNKLNLTEARLNKEAKNKPQAWRLALDCLHSPILTEQEIKNAFVEKEYRPDGADEFNIVCPQCSRHEPGSCDQYKIIHRVVSMTPMYSRHLKEQKQNEQH